VFRRLLRRIASALQKHDIPYMVIGGQAVLLYGEPRLTKDIDITLGVGIDFLIQIERIVKLAGLSPLVSNVADFVKETMVFPVQDRKSGIRVDFIFSSSSYEKQAIQRALGVHFGKTMVKFAAVEDVIIHKVIAGRARDMEDVQAIMLKKHDCNISYIGKWLKKFDTALGGRYWAEFQALIKKLKK
jgi:predicted nucleotidyltransferase